MKDEKIYIIPAIKIIRKTTWRRIAKMNYLVLDENKDYLRVGFWCNENEINGHSVVKATGNDYQLITTELQ